jgi:hypothetical protein
MSQESNDDDDGDVKDYCAAFLRLEPDIRDLVRAVNIVMLTVLDEDCNELTRFAIEQIVPRAEALKKRYYNLHKQASS